MVGINKKAVALKVIAFLLSFFFFEVAGSKRNTSQSFANCRFSHDVTKIETIKLLILLRFNFMMYKSSLKLLFMQIFAPNEFLVLR